MSRWNSVLPILLAFIAALLAPAGARADEVAAWLERHGLLRLLALHLEQQIPDTQGDDRERLAIQLAHLYATLLETTTDTEQRIDLERRSRELIQQMREGAADELQLALQRGLYRAAERIAEDHRLRLGPDEEADRALRMLDEIVPALETLRTRLMSQLNAGQQRLSRASPGEATTLGETLRAVEQRVQSTTFLLAWSSYYRDWLLGRSAQSGRRAQELFAWLLDSDTPVWEAHRVSSDLLEVEAFARTVLGMALAKSLSTSATIGDVNQWLMLLERDHVHSSVRESLPAWWLAAAAQVRAYSDMRRNLEQADKDMERVPLAWIRLAAVTGLEAGTNPDGAGLATFALAQLASRSELGQVLDLARRYRDIVADGSDFAAFYVRGVLAYQRARELHTDEEPTTDPEARGLYEEATKEFVRAMDAHNVTQYEVAAAGCRRLIGWCHYFRGELVEARDAFVRAAERLPPAEAPEALWMAIVSVDRLFRQGEASAGAELDELIERFLQQFPASEYAPRLVLRRSEGVREPSLELVDELLMIPENSDVYGAARRRAAQMLYQLFRAPGADRVTFGTRYLALALPLLMETPLHVLAENQVELQAQVIRARRILEVSLHEGIDRHEAAVQALARLEEIRDLARVYFAEFEDELDYRRLILAMRTDRISDAVRLADQLWERDKDSMWATASIRAVFREAYERMRAPRDDDEAFDDRPVLARLFSFGERVLEEMGSDPESLAEARNYSYVMAIADAGFRLWEAGRSREIAAKAMALYENLLHVRPRNADFIERFALMAEVLDRPEEALEHWRQLVTGVDSQSERWYRAKYHQIALLKTLDPRRAREVMDQHRTLRPEYGPEPWRTRLRELDHSITAPGGGTRDGEGGP